MAIRSGGQEIEFKVRLGLEGAIEQATQLKQLLKDSVKPDTTDYKSITQTIDKITKSAEGLRDKMKEAFKTSSGTKAFMKEYSQLSSLIEGMGERFSNVHLENMLMPADKLQELKGYNNELKNLEKSIGLLQNNKIADIFGADNNANGIERIRSIIADLGGDVSKISFDQLGSKLSEQFESAGKRINVLKEKIDEVNHLSQNFGGSNGGKLVESLKASTKDNITNKLVDTKEIAKAKVALEDYYNFLSTKGIATKRKAEIKEGTSVGDFIENETKRINQLYEDQAASINAGREKVAAVIDQIDNYQRAKKAQGHGTTLSNDQINKKFLTVPSFQAQLKDALAAIGKDISQYDFSSNTQKAFNQMKADLRKGLEDLVNSVDTEQSKQEIINKLKAVFDGITGTPVVAPGQLESFRSNLEAELKKFNLSFDAIGFDAKSIKAGAQIASIYDQITTKIGQCIQARQEDATTSKKELKDEEAGLEQLKAAQIAFTEAKENIPNLIAGKESSIDGITQKMMELAQVWSQMTGKSIGEILNLDSLKSGQQALDGFLNGLIKVENRQKSLSNIQMAINRWMGFYQVLNLTKRAVNSMKQHITELDTVMTKIAVVTNMSQDTLWGQIGQYSEMARQYGVAIKGVYEVSQLYYQQGLQKGDVMTLTQETLKMARIAGIEYSTAADYMTTAIRGFKLEMSDAGHVTDVFSNLAANTASSTEELAVAISKTAASAASVGSSFEATSAMMSTMIATTRESATNIGTALKSIISRYGEMKENLTGTDTEGEEYSLNKVDKALQSVGISIHDANGQFRDFDDVILELATAWDTIDKNTQRYIATVMAGNRQQSRFLALVSNVDEYKRALELANDAEGAGEIQTLKTLDSIDAKVERLKVTIQEFYTSSGIQDLYKGILDTITNIIDTANNLPKVFKNIPAAALSIGVQVVSTIKSVLTLIVASISQTVGELKGQSTSWLTGLSNRIRESVSNGFKQGANEGEAHLKQTGKTSGLGAGAAVQMLGAGLKVAGSYLTLSAMNQYAQNKKITEDTQTGWTMLGGAGAGVLGSALSGAAFGGPIGAIIGGLTGIITNLGSISSAFQMLLPDATQRLKRERELSQKNLSEARQQESIDKGVVKEYETAHDKFISLEEASHSSSEAMQEFIDYQNQLAESYPSLVDHLDEAGNSVITLTKLEGELAKARQASAASVVTSTENEIEDQKTQVATYDKLSKEIGDFTTYQYNSNIAAEILGVNPNNWQGVNTLATNFQQWAAVNQPNLKVDTGSLTTTNFLAWQKQYQSALNQYYTEMINNPELMKNVSSDTKSRIEGQKKNGLLSRYKQALENAITVDSDLTYAQLTGQTGLKDLSEMDEWSLEKLQSVMQWTKDHAEQYIKSIVDNIGDLDELLTQEKVDLQVQNEISKYSSTEAETLNKYSSFVSNMIRRQNKEKNGEWYESSEGMQAVTNGVEEWNEWLIRNEEDAEWLMKEFDFSQISGSKNGIGSAREKLAELFAQHNINEQLNNYSSIFASYFQDYETYADNLRKGFNSAIGKYLKFEESGLSDKDIKQFEELFDGKDTELTGELTKQVQSQLSQYKKLQKSGNTIDAANYATNLLNFYQSIASLEEDEDKNAVAKIIKDIDFSDATSLETISESLKEAGYNDLAQQLTQASNTLGINVAAQAQSLSDALKETVKDIEDVTEKIGKGMKFSDALESAKKILEKAGKDAEGIALTETDEQAGLLAYDKSLGEYVLTTTAITTWISSLQKDSADQIDKLNRSNTIQSTLLSAIKSAQIDTFDELSAENAENFGRGATSQYSAFQHTLKEQGYDLTEEEISQYAAQAQRLVNEFQEARKAGNKQTWEEFIAEKQKILSENEKLDMEILANATKNSVLAQISSYDFSSIATGREGKYSKSNLRALLEAAGVKTTDEKGFDMFETMYAQLLGGDLSLLDRMLESAGGGLGDQIQDETHQGIVSSYQDAIQYLTDKDHNPLTNAIQAQIDAVKQKYKLDENATEDEVLSYMQKDMAQFQAWSWATLAQVQETQADIIKKNQREAGIGKSKALSDAMKDNITIDELKSLQETWGLQIFDKNNELVEGLAKYYQQNADTGEYELKIPEGMDFGDVMTEIFSYFGLKLSKTSKLYKELFKSQIDKDIQDLDAADIGKQAASTLSSIASAKAGTRLDVSGLPQELQDSLGANAQHIAEITSEYQRDSWLLGLDISAIDDNEWRAAVQEQQRQIQQKRNQQNAISGIVSKNIGLDQARAYVTSIRHEEVEKWTDKDLQNWMESRGYIWDAFSQEFRATDKALETINNEIDSAIANKASEESINELQAQAAQLEYDLKQDHARDALNNLLSGYTDITGSLAEFQAQFDITATEMSQYYTEDATGAKKLNVSKLKAELADKFKEKLGENWEEIFEETIGQIADSYMDNISKASSLATEGTTSNADIRTFTKRYNELFEGANKTADELFNYNTITASWTLRAEAMAEVLDAEAQNLIENSQLDKTDVEQWKRDQLKANTIDKIDFKSVLSSSTTDKSRQEMKSAIETYYVGQVDTNTQNWIDYYKSLDFTTEEATSMAATGITTALDNAKQKADDTYNRILAGGEDAAKALEEVDVDATAEDLQAAYDSTIAPLRNLVDTVEELKAGTFVEKSQIEALRQAGFTVQDNGLITEAGKLVNAYKSFYDQMKSNMQATTEDLNKAFAKYMTEAERGDIDAIEAMGDAMGMTYETLGEILGKEGTSLETWLQQNQDLYKNIGAGKVRLTDFKAFAKQRGWQEGSEEYIKSFSEYNDSLIEHNKSAKENILNEIKNLEEAKPGDQLNFTYLNEKLNTLQSEKIEDYIKIASTTTSNEEEVQAIAQDMVIGAKSSNNNLKKIQSTMISRFKQYGATFKNGILTLSKDANLMEITRAVTDAAKALEYDAPEAIAQMEATLATVIQGYTEAINKGISGGMNAVEKEELVIKAKNLGLKEEDMHFQEAADGFKLATSSAIKYYRQLDQLDVFQGSTAFDNLSSALQSSNDEYKDTASILRRIATLQRRINKISADGYSAIDSAHQNLLDDLNDELDLAKEIASTKASESNESFDFMNDNDATPSSFDNVLDYWGSWQQARKFLGSTNHRTDYNQFLEILKEASSLAEETGDEFTLMGKKIDSNTYSEFLQNMGNYIAYDENGSKYFTDAGLKSFGFNMSLGSRGISEGLWGAAQKHIGNYEAYVQNLHDAYAGIGDLGDYVAENGLSFEDFIDKATGEFSTDAFNKQLDGQTKIMESFKKFASNIETESGNLYDILTSAGKKFEKGSKEYEAIQSLFELMSYDDFDASKGYRDIVEHMARAGLSGEYKIGDTKYKISGKHILEQDTKDKEHQGQWQTPDGKYYSSDAEALKALNEKDIENFKKSVEKYGKLNEAQEITADGRKVTLKIDSETGKIQIEGKEGLYDDIDAAIKSVYDSYEPQSGTEKISYSAWYSKNFGNSIYKYGKNSTLTSDQRSKMRSMGMDFIDGFNDVWNDLVSSYGDDAVFQLSDLLGMNLGDNNAAVEKLKDQLITQAQMDEVAASVETGIKNAFSKEGGAGEIAQTLGSAIAQGFAEGGVEIPELTLSPESINVETGEITPGKIQDYTIPGGNVTIQPKSVTIETSGTTEGTENITGETDGIPVKIQPTFDGVNPFEGQVFDVKVNMIPNEEGPKTSKESSTTSSKGAQQQTKEGVSQPLYDFSGTAIPLQKNTTYEVEPHFVEKEAPTITGGEVVYDTPTISIEGPEGPEGTGNIDYNSFSISIEGPEGPPGHGTIIYDKAEVTVSAPEGGGSVGATGNAGLATGNAHAKSTLMGELGPEMVVSNGRYFVAGQNGPEFVNLAKDAIVFNHLQTQALLTKGTSSTRGHAITNERNAVAYAHGNVNGGFAKAGSASSQADKLVITNTSSTIPAGVKSAVTGASEEATKALEAFIKELDRWYNQLQEIARLEEKVTYQEQLRAKINSDLSKNGSAYYKSLKQSITDLNDELVANQVLVTQQQAYLDKRIQVLNNSAFGAVYKLENGQVKYKNNNIKEQFDAVFGQADTNEPNQTSKSQYQWLVNQGYGAFMKYDKSGKEIKFTNDNGEEDESAYKTAVQAFWDRLDAQLDEVQGLVDSINEHEQAILEAQEAQNELVREMQDNQLEVEEKVLDAVVEIRERAIDELEDQRDVYSDYADKMIDGLNNALTKERQMYDMQEDQAETDRMRRRLAILMSAGGSASEITDLQSQIRQRDKDMYFDQQQQQIDAIKEASDLEIERLDEQIELQRELLEYQKEHGLLWNDVYVQMEKSPEEIANFIMTNTESFWGNSPMKNTDEMDNLLFASQKWAEYRDELASDIESPLKRILESILANDAAKEWENYVQTLKAIYGEDFEPDDELKQAYISKYKETSDPNQAGAAVQAILAGRNSGGGGSGGAAASSGNGWVYDKPGKWIKSGDRWWYQHDEVDEFGKDYTTDNWERINGRWYHFDSEGWMQTGWFQDTDGKWYYLNDNKGSSDEGSMLTGTHQLVWNGKKENHTFDGSGAWIGSTPISNGQSKKNISVPGAAVTSAIAGGVNSIKKLLLPGAASGAFVDQEGIAKIHDNELILTAEQTAFLRDDILGNHRNSLMSMLIDFRNAYAGIGSAANSISTTDQGITIEHAEVNMNVEQLANDYDAKRAGEQALEEMLRIARKSGATAVRR